MIPIWTVDFETQPTGPRPEHYPPKPAGVSIRRPEGTVHYFAWDHPTGNNCTWDDARRALREVWDSGLPVAFHHAKFDTEVAYVHFDLPELPWERIHDTMFLGFLVDPYARSIGLKQLGVIWLGMDPDEQDAVCDWIMANKAHLPRFEFVTNSKKEPFGNPTLKNFGAWIAYAPAEIVGPYANGDTERTWKLFQILFPIVEQAGMLEAYDRERQVMPIFQENERVGMRVDLPRLEHDVELYQRAFEYVEDWLRWRLNAQGLNFDADADVADVLARTGIVTEWTKTKTGKRSTSKDNMHPDMFNDPQVAQALGYRNRLQTCLKMFMIPWLKQATHRGGRISTSWNQVASDMGGTRTGRPSTYNPNFLNLSKSFFNKGDGYEHPVFLGVPELPLVRRYVLSDEGCVVLKRDYSGQELRVFGHFEHGDLFRQYQKDPNLDVHNYVGGKIGDITGDAYWRGSESRGKTKVLNFQGMYGGGVPAAQKALRCTYQEAQRFKAFHDQALPGRKILSDTLSRVVRMGYAVRTWGGRLYVRPPLKKQKNGRLGDADYILINYLIQGSSAEITKEAMIRLHSHPDYRSRFMLQVYDEMNISAPIDDAVRQMEVLQESMEGVSLRVPLLTDGEWGANWGEMHKIKGPLDEELGHLREIMEKNNDQSSN